MSRPNAPGSKPPREGGTREDCPPALAFTADHGIDSGTMIVVTMAGTRWWRTQGAG